MKTLLKHYRAWLKKAEAGKARLARYKCPHCKSEIKTPKPLRSEDKPYDSMAVCPFCEKIYFKVVYNDGQVNIYVREVAA